LISSSVRCGVWQGFSCSYFSLHRQIDNDDTGKVCYSNLDLAI
jgi:hypothetical protein